MSTSKDWMVYFWKCENKPENKRKFSELTAVGANVLAGVFEADTDTSRITATIKDNTKIGSNLKAHLKELKSKMLKAAEDLNFEEAALIRDEVKRLEAVDLAIASDPMVRQSAVEAIASGALKRGRSTGGRSGTRVYKGKSVKKI